MPARVRTLGIGKGASPDLFRTNSTIHAKEANVENAITLLELIAVLGILCTIMLGVVGGGFFFIINRLDRMETKMEAGLKELDEKMEAGLKELGGEIGAVQERLTAVETKVESIETGLATIQSSLEEHIRISDERHNTLTNRTAKLEGVVYGSRDAGIAAPEVRERDVPPDPPPAPE